MNIGKSEKLRLMLSWEASCGGCDVSILDMGSKILNLDVEILYWPVAMDTKREELEVLEKIDIGIVNGGIRTSEQAKEVKIIRSKSKILIAYGSCACFGGIPGLANQFEKPELLKRAYVEVESNDNPQSILPEAETGVGGLKLELPELYDVKPLSKVVDVNYYVPGCPPSINTVKEVFENLGPIAEGRFERDFFASNNSLCYECPRNEGRVGRRIERLYRPHETQVDERCLLEQGVPCLGFATRGGCKARCISANMPCRGCYGPLPSVYDAGMSGLTGVAAFVGKWEDELPDMKQMERINIRDAVGLFYRFTLALKDWK